LSAKSYWILIVVFVLLDVQSVHWRLRVENGPQRISHESGKREHEIDTQLTIAKLRGQIQQAEITGQRKHYPGIRQIQRHRHSGELLDSAPELDMFISCIAPDYCSGKLTTSNSQQKAIIVALFIVFYEVMSE
jgi:hypothetical protein